MRILTLYIFIKIHTFKLLFVIYSYLNGHLLILPGQAHPSLRRFFAKLVLVSNAKKDFVLGMPGLEERADFASADNIYTLPRRSPGLVNVANE